MEPGSSTALHTPPLGTEIHHDDYGGDETDTPSLEGMTLDLQTDEVTGLVMAKRMLIGKVLTDKPLNKNALKSVVLKAWNNPPDLHMTDMGINCILFTFQSESRARRIYEEGPWSVMGNILSLQQWAPELNVFEVRFNIVAFWIQIHGLPLEAMSTTNAAKIATSIGELVEVENPYVEGKMLRPFFRVRVLVNTDKSLPTGFWVPRKSLPKVWAYLRYEKLQGFCFKCGKIGHEQRNCKAQKAMSTNNPNNPRFAPNLGVSMARSLASIAAARRYGGHHHQEPTMEHMSSQHSRGEEQSNLQPQAEVTTNQNETQRTNQQEPQTENLANQIVSWPSIPHPTVEGPLASQTDTEVRVEDTEGRVEDRNPPGPLIEPRNHRTLRATLRVTQQDIQNAEATMRREDRAPGFMVNPGNTPGPRPNFISRFPSQIPPIQLAPTMVPLHSSLKSPGLGPEKLTLLHLEKEDIGLNDKVIILDYPSPIKGADSHFGANLSEEDVHKARAKLTHHPSKAENCNPTTNLKLSANEASTLGELHKGLLDNNYFVELPDEDEEHTETPPQAIEDKIEVDLASGFSLSLALEKRKRNDLPHNKAEGGQGRQKLRICNSILNALPRPTVDTAEEAGLAMPPTPK